MEKEYLVSYILYKKEVISADTMISGKPAGGEIVSTSQSIRSQLIKANSKKETLYILGKNIIEKYGKDSAASPIAITCLDED